MRSLVKLSFGAQIVFKKENENSAAKCSRKWSELQHRVVQVRQHGHPGAVLRPVAQSPEGGDRPGMCGSASAPLGGSGGTGADLEFGGQAA